MDSVHAKQTMTGTKLAISSAPEPEIGLAEFVDEHRQELEATIADGGALLFRGFRVDGASAFERAARTVTPELLDYTYRSTPRTEEKPNIYTSTEYPPDQEILLHNENSYAATWPLKIWFFCELPAASGGATPIADSRRVYERIDPRIREQFAEKGVMYVRNYTGVMDLGWQEVFQTTDRSAVEEFCRRNGIELEWDGDDLRTRQVCQGVARHPRTGELLWFNQAHLFHPSGLPAETREALVTVFTEEGLPRNALYGDGTPIDDDDLARVREAYDAEAIDVEWERGDVLLLDNMLVAHGRRSYSPPRKVLVAMAEPVGHDDVAEDRSQLERTPTSGGSA
jgi:alpha-ketoglutarate-dependent taurine dioxygenase